MAAASSEPANGHQLLPGHRPPDDHPPTADCRGSCNAKFVDFCKLHCVSHHNCPKLLCELCANDKLDLSNLQWHISSEKHKDKHRQLMKMALLINMPLPTQTHTDKLTVHIVRVAEENQMTQRHISNRDRVARKINKLLEDKKLNQFQVRVFGSTISGFGLKHSDLNLEMIAHDDADREKLVTNLADISKHIEGSREFTNVDNEFNIKTPKIHFNDVATKIKCELTIHGGKSYKTSHLLRCYTELDKRVAPLAIVLRKWANTYQFDSQENGTFPAHAFSILVIHYLQRCQPPVLPCIHELFPEKQSNAEACNSANKNDAEKDTESDDIPDFNLKKIKETWKCENKQTVGELWLGMLRYYSVCLDPENEVVSIRRTGKPETHYQKHWSSRILAIEDPCRPSLNLSRSVGNMNIFNHFLHQLRETYKYFAIPRVAIPNKEKPKVLEYEPLFAEKDFETSIDPFVYQRPTFEDIYTKLHYINLDSSVDDELKLNNDEHESEEKSEDKKNENSNTLEKAKKLLRKFGIKLSLNEHKIRQVCVASFNDIGFCFEFKKLPFFQRAQKFCRLCHKFGHYQINCPDEKLPDLIELQPLNIDYKKSLDNICYFIYKEQKFDQKHEITHQYILEKLQEYIQKNFDSQARLEFFGSIKNGFGAKHCDLDICLTLEYNKTGEGLDETDIINKIAKILEKNQNVDNVLAITSAKVPIAKFCYKYFQQESNFRRYEKLECDISLYNLLARYNTKLLQTYCAIDPRVPFLGMNVKYFAKTCEIGDASRGSLSSYAYILMTLHFLQQRNVIPVLQEIDKENKEERIVQEWDTWFFEDLEKLPKFWTPTNKDTVGELFLDFFRYYSEEFKFDTNVVCCRKKELLTRLEKNWTGRKIAIEDPFNLAHNLGAGVDDQMANFIKVALIKARNLFGTNHDSSDPKSMINYLFDKRNLTEGRLPTGHGCRWCGKIGHKVNQCPNKRTRQRERETRDTKMKQKLMKPLNKQEPIRRRQFEVEDQQHQQHQQFRQNQQQMPFQQQHPMFMRPFQTAPGFVQHVQQFQQQRPVLLQQFPFLQQRKSDFERL